jgi:ElaB/YqjD/DUF883 family membrane-anchored ribosome-binding protein
MEQMKPTTNDSRLDAQAQPAAADAGGLQDSMKEFGVDTDRMIEATSERVNNLQQVLIEEVQARPMRALGWAAAAGFVLGIIAAR